MKEAWSGRWYVQLLVTIASMLALMVVVGAVNEALAGPADTAGRRTTWRPHLERVEAAILRRDTEGALMAWREAYAGALASRQWEGLVEVADAYLKIGDADASRAAALPKARRIYRAALFRARHAGSVTGVLRVAEAFGVFGDDDVVETCIRVARELAAQAHDAASEERVRSFATRWLARELEVEQFHVAR